MLAADARTCEVAAAIRPTSSADKSRKIGRFLRNSSTLMARGGTACYGHSLWRTVPMLLEVGRFSRAQCRCQSPAPPARSSDTLRRRVSTPFSQPLPMNAPNPLRLHTLLGDYPTTLALKRGQVQSPHISLAFADVKVPNTAFKRLVRNLEFDVSELAIVTFLMAKAHGKPLSLLPAVVLARFQHPYLVYNAERGRFSPGGLAGRRVGVRSYSVTTAMWIRGILAEDYGVDLDRVQWIAFEEAHVAQYPDPPGVERAAPGSDPMTMLLEGTLDAAVLAAPSTDPRIQTLIPDPAAAARRSEEH